MFLIQKYTQYKAAQAEQQKKKVKVTEKELTQLNHKIDKLLTKLDEHEPEIAENQDEECVVCVTAKATMQTYPCEHRVVCRTCFVKTIKMAVGQRLLPLRCVLCRAKILRLKHSSGPLPTSESQYSIGSQWYHVPQSASLYSVSSGMSGISGISGISSASSCSSGSSYKTCASAFSSASLKKRTYAKQGYQPLRTSSPSPTRSPKGCSVTSKPSETKSLEDNKKLVSLSETDVSTSQINPPPLKGKLSLIQEFQREFRNGKSKAGIERKGSAGSHRSGSGNISGSSTRIKSAGRMGIQTQSSIDLGTSSERGRMSTTALTKTSSNANIGFRRANPPPSSQSFHSFRISRRHDSVAPVPQPYSSSSYFKFKKGSLQTIPDE